MSLTNFNPQRELDAHLKKRPARPDPIPDVDTPEWRVWYKAYTKWVDEKGRLEFQRDHGHRVKHR